MSNICRVLVEVLFSVLKMCRVLVGRCRKEDKEAERRKEEKKCYVLGGQGRRKTWKKEKKKGGKERKKKKSRHGLVFCQLKDYPFTPLPISLEL
ncbi:hypothetical protein K457DRAFT_1344469 [Linnemannia elongata AG-77]|uniref:Uncharacterized protein n=1 Tax=Linnemannia elongata AG-77 TaxID=1314771 RepID=A0A197KHP9_9FUNG|nr:hypothetical protein K457DRAFT_1344469 [Linnemannia elongata AG-77]